MNTSHFQSNESSSVPPVFSPPPVYIPSKENMMVTSSRKGAPPRWFWGLFLLVFVAFLGMTYKLLTTLWEVAHQNTVTTPRQVVSPTPPPTLVPLPTSVMPDESSSHSKLPPPLTPSDSITDIETDMTQTDLSFIDGALLDLDQKSAEASIRR